MDSDLECYLMSEFIYSFTSCCVSCHRCRVLPINAS